MALKQNIIYVYFKGKHLTTSKSQYQYNHGQFLYFADLNLPQAFEVHFSNEDKGYSKPKVGSNKLVEIPDEYFWSGASQIYAWVYLHSDTDDGETIYEVKIPLTKRAKPTDEQPLPQQESAMERAIAELNNAVEITTENANKTEEDKTQVGNIRDEVVDLKENIDATAETVAQKSQEAIDASRRSEASAQNAAEFEDGARRYSEDASQSAQEALESKNIAKQKAQVANDASAEAKDFRDEAETFKNEAEQAKQNIVDYRDETKGYRDETLTAKDDAQTIKGDVQSLKTQIDDTADNVFENAREAYHSMISADNASLSASESAENASQSANEANQSATNASESAGQAEEFKNQSEEYKSQSETFKNQAEEFKNQTETNVTHYPKIIGEYWYVWDATNGEYINTNVDANGIKGDTGRGIASIALNNDYTLTITFTDDTTYTTSSIRGQQGEKGDTGESGVYIGTEEPENEDIKVWIDTDDDGTSEDLVKNIESLKENIYKPYAVDFASGSIASFSDGADDIPLKNLVVDINPVQDLHGYDHPWVGGGGKNLCPTPIEENVVYKNGGYLFTITFNNGVMTWDITNNASTYFMLKAFTITQDDIGKTYTMSYKANPTISASDSCLRLWDGQNRESLASTSATITEDMVGKDLCLSFYKNGAGTYTISDVQLEEGSTATEWTPYENICPVGGWTGATIQRTGENLLGGITLMDAIYAIGNLPTKDETAHTVTFNASGGVSGRAVGNVVYKSNTRYTFILTLSNTSATTGTNFRVWYTDGTSKWVDKEANKNKQTIVFVTHANKTVYKLALGNAGGYTTVYCDESGVFEGVLIASDFKPYVGQSITISWETEAGTVYGGKLDVLSGVMRVTHQIYTYDGSADERWAATASSFYIPNPQKVSQKVVCNAFLGKDPKSYVYLNNGECAMTLSPHNYINFIYSAVTSLEEWKAWLAEHPIQLLLQLVTPTEIQLDVHTINSLLGQNNIFADTGDTHVEYRADTKLYINKKIAEALASLT